MATWIAMLSLAATLSAPASAGVPPTPMDVRALSHLGSVLISWPFPDGVQRVRVERSSTAGGLYERIGEWTGSRGRDGRANYWDEGLDVGETYYYVLTAITAQGESEPSAEVSAIVAWRFPEIRLHLRTNGARELESDTAESSWVIGVAPPFEDFVPVTVDVHLHADVQPCPPGHPGCGGDERSVIVDAEGNPSSYQCADHTDNDGDGLTDDDDPDCAGVEGWSMSVITAECFHITSATVRGTGGDLDIRPPGVRDSQGGNFERTEVVNPDWNGGLAGAVSAIVLGLNNPITLPPSSDLPVLRLTGALSTAGLDAPSARTEPCALRVAEPRNPHESRLVGSGEPMNTLVTVWGGLILPQVESASVALEWDPNARVFRRGDADGDGSRSLTDGVVVLGYLFLGRSPPSCLDAADTDDNTEVQLHDAVYLFNHLFLGGPPPAAPLECGVDPTEDALTCLEPADCL